MKVSRLAVLSVILSILQISSLIAQSQGFISSTKNGTLSVEKINSRMKAVFVGTSSLPNAEKSVDLYKILYKSVDEKNRSVTLSGLLAVPENGGSKGLVIFNHGTIVSSKLAPSNFTGQMDSSEREVAALAFASGGYAVAMPDYLGLGDHKGAHPYPLGAANSRSAIDMIQPVRTFAARQNISIGSRLFISGYSEGGAVAMWNVRDLEKKAGAEYNVFAAAPMSGSYDLSGITRKWLLSSPTTQEEFVIRLYLTSYMIYYFHKSLGLKITNYFKPAMALTISQAFKGNISDEDVIKRLALAAVLMRSKNSLENVITPRFKNALQTMDISDPVISEMKKSDCFDWSPRTKLLLINLIKDNVVDPENTAKTIQTMRRRGIGANLLRQYVVEDTSVNHITGFPMAMSAARKFFDNGF